MKVGTREGGAAPPPAKVLAGKMALRLSELMGDSFAKRLIKPVVVDRERRHGDSHFEAAVAIGKGEIPNLRYGPIKDACDYLVEQCALFKEFLDMRNLNYRLIQAECEASAMVTTERMSARVRLVRSSERRSVDIYVFDLVGLSILDTIGGC